MNEKEIEAVVRQVMRELLPSYKISLSEAKILMEAVEQEAKRQGIKAVIAVSDEAGRPIGVHCMDGAYIGSYDIAVNKTYTAAAFQMATSELAALAAPGASLYGIEHTNEGKIVIFGGGEPLHRNGRMVGAVGVSGGTAEQDTRLGAYAKQFFETKQKR